MRSSKSLLIPPLAKPRSSYLQVNRLSRSPAATETYLCSAASFDVSAAFPPRNPSPNLRPSCRSLQSSWSNPKTRSTPFCGPSSDLVPWRFSFSPPPPEFPKRNLRWKPSVWEEAGLSDPHPSTVCRCHVTWSHFSRWVCLEAD